MAFAFQCLPTFRSTLAEVDALLALAADNEEDETRYAATNKAAILLLTGKFESFAELLAAEFIYHINALNPSPGAIPLALRLGHTVDAIGELGLLLQHEHKREKAVEKLVELGALWGRDDPFVVLNVDCKFSYGAHGEAELRKLFAKIGFDDVFAEVLISEEVESMGASDSNPVDFRGCFNSVTNLRNNILHHDATAELTWGAVRKHRDTFEQYAEALTRAASERLQAIQVLCSVQ
jgi:hypothetical protein